MKFQRAQRGFSDCDWWNFCDWFSTIVPAMLTKLRDDGIDGYPEGFGTVKSSEDWKKILTDIIEGFELYKKAEDIDLIFETEEQCYYKNSPTRIRCYNPSGDGKTWFFPDGVDAQVGMRGRYILSPEEEKKYKRAMQLFAFYWPAMWD